MDNLIKIDLKPIEKLIDVISNGIGTLYRPRAIRKEADARAYEIKVIEKAKCEALAEGKIIEAENLARINERLVAKETIRQNNIDDVVEIASKEFELETVVSNSPVDKDWATRFFDIVQDVSNEEMKTLWGKILAGEVKSPKSYSLRTLELLRNISKEEAEIFVRVSQLVLRENGYFIYSGKGDGLLKFGVHYSDIAKLIEIGLIQAGTFVQKQYKPYPDDDGLVTILYSDYILLATVKQGTSGFSIPVHMLTSTGVELYQLIAITPDINYLKNLALSIKRESVSVEYARVKSIEDDGRVNYHLPTIKV